MRRSITITLFLLLLLAAVATQPVANAQGAPRTTVQSVYTLNRYGFATINESVSFSNNESSAVSPPTLTFGFGPLASDVVAYNLTGTGFTLATPSSQGGPFTVSGTQSIAAGGNATYVLSALVNGEVSTNANGSITVLTLSSPSISSQVNTLVNVVQMPVSTSFVANPANLTESVSGTNITYFWTRSTVTPLTAITSVNSIESSTAQDFNPLRVYYVQRSITAGSNGDPLVTDTVEFQNMGTTPLQTLYVTPLAPVGVAATIEEASEPKLLSPVSTTLASNSIDLTQVAVGYPSDGVPAGTNFTVVYQYALGGDYYTISGGRVSLNIPLTPPVPAFADTYVIKLSLPSGSTSTESTPTTLSDVTPWQSGSTQFSYGLSLGWAVSAGVPLATFVFVLLLVGLFALRTAPAESEEAEEEESSSELASTMIKAFDEKTNLINSLWPEISSKDPNEMNKEYFDELRGRLDTFRGRALQRLNEVKQKSTSQKFYEVVNQIHQTEREVDRASKDKLNLYQQYYMRQMRKEVYDRLLPQYTKRLEKALNQLSDELHTVQREAKLL